MLDERNFLFRLFVAASASSLEDVSQSESSVFHFDSRSSSSPLSRFDLGHGRFCDDLVEIKRTFDCVNLGESRLF